jgi:hypothetical protein
MRNFSLLSLLLATALIAWMAKGYFAPAVSHDPNDKATVEYWVAHTQDRTTMLAWCQQHPQSQDTGECQLATSAQVEVDTNTAPKTQPATNHAADQNGGAASDELQAQQDSNAMDPGGQ